MLVLVCSAKEQSRTQTTGLSGSIGLRHNRCYCEFVECPVVKNKATTRVLGDDLTILARLCCKTRKKIGPYECLLSDNSGRIKKK